MINPFRKFYLFCLISLAMLLSPFSGLALMQSASYRIYETVLQEFDGPVISNVAATAGETTATVSWDTDVVANGFVIYDTDSAFSNSKEQGASAKSGTSQSVSLVGLSAATTYYYRPKSGGLNNGVSTDTTSRSFTTSASSVTPAPQQQGGGGILIIDKRDKITPAISDIRVDKVISDGATISWQTDEEANSFVEYGQTIVLGGTYGRWDAVKSHSVNLTNLTPETKYYFKVLSADSSGNLASSTAQSFTTLSLLEELTQEKPPGEDKEQQITNLTAALEKARDLINQLAAQVSINVLESNLSSHLSALELLNSILPGPILSAEPKVIVGAKEATVIWQTNVDATSQVAVASAESYNAVAREPYAQIIGNAEDKSKDHEVEIINLSPDTLYHYQLRSKGTVGPMARSKDFTFKTKTQELEITNPEVKIVSPEEIEVRWLTSSDTDASLRYIPYRGNTLAVSEAKAVSDDHLSIVHQLKITDLEGGVIYDLELSGKDASGRVVSHTISTFSTAKDNLPPVITQVRTDTAISPGKETRVQVIIYWLTNEAATSQVFYQQGVTISSDLKEKTQPDTNYTKKHVAVLTKFKPGEVYSFRVESADSSGNTTRSKAFTILAPKQKESIFQLILRILEQTFGWIGSVRR